MQSGRSYGVAWREGRGETFVGRLDLNGAELELSGGPGRVVPYAEILHVRIGRVDGERVNGERAVIVEHRGGSQLHVAPLDGPGRAAELADLVATRSHAR
jgi:hypothetical protein